jgi:hypothetical protein
LSGDVRTTHNWLLLRQRTAFRRSVVRVQFQVEDGRRPAFQAAQILRAVSR